MLHYLTFGSQESDAIDSLTDTAPPDFPSTLLNILNLPVEPHTPLESLIGRPPVSRTPTVLSEPDIIPSFPLSAGPKAAVLLTSHWLWRVPRAPRSIAFYSSTSA